MKKFIALVVVALVIAGCIYRNELTGLLPSGGTGVDKGDSVQMPAASDYTVGSRDYPPQQTLNVNSFEISKHEVTEALYKAVMGGEAVTAERFSELSTEGPPACDMSWRDAALFCNKLSTSLGLDTCYDEGTFECDGSKNGYRLPTSAEWEYACRGDSNTAFFWGNDTDGASKTSVQDQEKPEDVGSKDANPQGLFDMTGNVSEWCNDRFPNQESWRVYRGGSYQDEVTTFESKWLGGMEETEHWKTIGFRIVRTVRGQ